MRRTLFVWGAALLVLAVVILLYGRSQSAEATHQPADKIAVAGNSVDVMNPNETETLLSGRLRTSAPTDLIFHVTAECALTTRLKTVGNDDAAAHGTVKAQVLVDGQPVKVTNDGNDPDGKVVLCNRAEERKTLNFSDEDATIETFQNTRQANGFNWIKLNLGSGIHQITVRFELEQKTDQGDATATAAVGKRTLIVEPAKLANDAGI